MVRSLSRLVPLAGLTNKPARAAEKILSLLGLAADFREVLGGDGTFGRKPAPDGLRHLMAASGAEAARTLMVGDSTVDLLTARAAGTRACLVRYGFGFAGLDRTKLGGDEVFADSPSEVAALILDGRDGG